MHSLVFADLFSPGVIALMIPLVIFSIPIVALLAWHQQRMAVLLQHKGIDPLEFQQLQFRVEELSRQLAICQAALPAARPHSDKATELTGTPQ